MSNQGSNTLTISLSPEAQHAMQALSIYEPGPHPVALGVPSVKDLCSKYNSVKPYLDIAMPLLKPLVTRLPKGEMIFNGISFLTQIADVACPAANLQMFAESGGFAQAGLVPVLNVVNLKGSAPSETTNYSTAKISNGYGLLTKAGVSVQRGITATMHVEFIIDTVSNNSFKEWMDSQKHMYSNEQWHTLEENYSAGGFLGGVLGGCFGFAFGGGTYNHYKNSHDKEVEADSSDKQGFLKSLNQVQRSKVTIKGDITATGTSFIPVEGFVFVETTTIQFNDGSSLTVVNTSNPVVAQQDGNTQGLTGGGQQLNVVPIGQ
jgi:hypothetical protein